jgi:ABC-2 type transport system ATP-binding protein
MTAVARTKRRRAARRAGVLSVDGLSKAYGDVVAVDDVSLAVRAGEVHGLLGPNGAGKTTILKVVVGLLRADRGRVEIGGWDARSHGRSARACLGFAGQDVALYPKEWVRSNLSFFAGMLGVRAGQIAARVAEVVRQFEIGELADQKVGSLSGGQQRMVHLAVAVLHRPRLLVRDEPTAGSTPWPGSGCSTSCGGWRRRGTAILFSSHYLSEVENLCEQVTIINRGRVVAAGPVTDVIAQHGGGRVEIDMAGTVVVHDGDDVVAVLADVSDRGGIDGVRVIRPSLEAAFVAQVGRGGEGGGQATSTRRHPGGSPLLSGGGRPCSREERGRGARGGAR